MNHPGEIALLAAIAAPTVALVNNAQREHQEFMASVEAVARENGAVIEALGAAGIAVFPADDALRAAVATSSPGSAPMLTFALQRRGRRDRPTPRGAATAGRLQLHTPAGARERCSCASPAAHNVKNALAAAACALAAGCPLDAIARGLEAFEPVKGRSQLQALQRDGATVTLVDDTYNANPDSVRAAIDVLAELPGAALAGARRHGRGRRPGPGLPSRGRRLCAASAASSAVDGRRAERRRRARPSAGARHFDDVRALIAALARGAALRAACWSRARAS